MKILVIDDAERNIASAQATIGGMESVELTTCSTIEEAIELLGWQYEPFDAVLTDLFLPIGSYTGAGVYKKVGDEKKELPAGLVFAMKASNRGTPVVICTDADHHEDWICSLLDLICFPRDSWDRLDKHQKMVYIEARYASMEAYWDEEQKRIIPFENETPQERWQKPKVKDWLMALQKSRLFPEIFPDGE